MFMANYMIYPQIWSFWSVIMNIPENARLCEFFVHTYYDIHDNMCIYQVINVHFRRHQAKSEAVLYMAFMDY